MSAASRPVLAAAALLTASLALVVAAVHPVIAASSPDNDVMSLSGGGSGSARSGGAVGGAGGWPGNSRRDPEDVALLAKELTDELAEVVEDLADVADEVSASNDLSEASSTDFSTTGDIRSAECAGSSDVTKSPLLALTGSAPAATEEAERTTATSGAEDRRTSDGGCGSGYSGTSEADSRSSEGAESSSMSTMVDYSSTRQHGEEMLSVSRDDVTDDASRTAAALRYRRVRRQDKGDRDPEAPARQLAAMLGSAVDQSSNALESQEQIPERGAMSEDPIINAAVASKNREIEDFDALGALSHSPASKRPDYIDGKVLPLEAFRHHKNPPNGHKKRPPDTSSAPVQPQHLTQDQQQVFQQQQLPQPQPQQQQLPQQQQQPQQQQPNVPRSPQQQQTQQQPQLPQQTQQQQQQQQLPSQQQQPIPQPQQQPTQIGSAPRLTVWPRDKPKVEEERDKKMQQQGADPMAMEPTSEQHRFQDPHKALEQQRKQQWLEQEIDRVSHDQPSLTHDEPRTLSEQQRMSDFLVTNPRRLDQESSQSLRRQQHHPSPQELVQWNEESAVAATNKDPEPKHRGGTNRPMDAASRERPWLIDADGDHLMLVPGDTSVEPPDSSDAPAVEPVSTPAEASPQAAVSFALPQSATLVRDIPVVVTNRSRVAAPSEVETLHSRQSHFPPGRSKARAETEDAVEDVGSLGRKNLFFQKGLEGPAVDDRKRLSHTPADSIKQEFVPTEYKFKKPGLNSFGVTKSNALVGQKFIDKVNFTDDYNDGVSTDDTIKDVVASILLGNKMLKEAENVRDKPEDKSDTVDLFARNKELQKNQKHLELQKLDDLEHSSATKDTPSPHLVPIKLAGSLSKTSVTRPSGATRSASSNYRPQPTRALTGSKDIELPENPFSFGTNIPVVDPMLPRIPTVVVPVPGPGEIKGSPGNKLRLPNNATFVQRTVMETAVGPGPCGRMASGSALLVQNMLLLPEGQGSISKKAHPASPMCVARGRPPEMLPVAPKCPTSSSSSQQSANDPTSINLGAPGTLRGRPEVRSHGSSGIVPSPATQHKQSAQPQSQSQPQSCARTKKLENEYEEGNEIYDDYEGVRLLPISYKRRHQIPQLGSSAAAKRDPSRAKVEMTLPEKGILYGGDSGPEMVLAGTRVPIPDDLPAAHSGARGNARARERADVKADVLPANKQGAAELSAEAPPLYSSREMAVFDRTKEILGGVAKDEPHSKLMQADETRNELRPNGDINKVFMRGPYGIGRTSKISALASDPVLPSESYNHVGIHKNIEPSKSLGNMLMNSKEPSGEEEEGTEPRDWRTRVTFLDQSGDGLRAEAAAATAAEPLLIKESDSPSLRTPPPQAFATAPSEQKVLKERSVADAWAGAPPSTPRWQDGGMRLWRTERARRVTPAPTMLLLPDDRLQMGVGVARASRDVRRRRRR